MSCCNEFKPDWDRLMELGYMDKIRITKDVQGFKKGDIITDELGNAQKKLLLEWKKGEIVIDEKGKQPNKDENSTGRSGKKDGTSGSK